jgi:hypothetical protein
MRCSRTSSKRSPLFEPSTSTPRQPTGSLQAKPPSNTAHTGGEPLGSPPVSSSLGTLMAHCGRQVRST